MTLSEINNTGGVRQRYKNPKLTNWLYKFIASPGTAKFAFVGELIFPRTVQTSSNLMTDEIHPNYSYIAKYIANLIGYASGFKEARAMEAIYGSVSSFAAASANYATPWTVYGRVLEYTRNFKLQVNGFYNAQGTTFLDISVDNAYDALAKVKTGDVVNIADSVYIKLISSNAYSVQSATVFRITGTSGFIPANSITAGKVTIYRSIFNHSFDAERYLYDRKSFPYVRRVMMNTCGVNFMRITATIDDELTTNKAGIQLTGSQLQLSTGDVLVVQGQTALTLTSATFSIINTTQLQISKTADFSAYSNLPAYIFGNHDYEQAADNTVTATGTTGNQTINKQSGTVNIAAAGSSVTVTNIFVKTTSIVQAIIRTNDSTAVIKNVVPANGSFVINLNAATTAETSIGFIVYN
jgi:hypothetical protein